MLVLLSIADNADFVTGEAYPSVQHIAGKTRLSKGGVHNVLAKLLARGEISLVRKGARGRANLYRIEVDALRSKSDRLDEIRVQSLNSTAEMRSKSEGISSPASVPQPSEEPSDTPLAAAPPRKRARTARDDVFDTLAEVCGKNRQALTRTATGEIVKAAAEIVAAMKQEGIPEEGWAGEVRARSRTYRRQHPTWELTPSSLKKWWPELGAATKTLPPCPECGIGGGHHLADCSQRDAA